jgi:hypothetical protein
VRIPRVARVAIGLACALIALWLVARPYVDAAAFIARAADLPGAAARLATWRSDPIAEPTTLSIPSRIGAVPGRWYRPAAGYSRAVLLVPGVHRDGIDEARLTALARDLATAGYGVLTVAAPDLERFRITPQVTDVIEDAAAWASTQSSIAPDGRIGLVGVSFSGGLSIVAAGRPSIADKVAFVLSFGGHGDLGRVMHYLFSGEAQGDLDRARQSRVVLGADHVQVHPPHDYGVAVALLTFADRVVPPGQVEPLSRGIDGFLLASSLDMVDKPKAAQEFARMRDYAATLGEPARTLMGYVNDRAVDKLGPLLLPIVDALREHPAMPALSPERAPAPPRAPVFLLHGADDNVIPSAETVFLGEYLVRNGTAVHGLLSGLITHAEVNRSAGATEVWRLASFWKQVMAQ